MSKYPVKYYSASKKAWINIEDLHGSHLLNAWKKSKAAINNLPLFEALNAEVKARGLDKPREEAQA